MQDGAAPQHRRVLATYRLQLGPDLDLDAASALLPYLHRLGVSHVYASPVLQAAPGSTHGYDVIDPSRVSDELGGDAAWERFLDAASAHDMGVVLDIVPNHMAIAGRNNRWWWDLLENGPSSRYATYFDVNWNPPERRLRHTILMPVLGDHYGRVLERGELTLERTGGRVIVRYHEHEFPVAVDTLTTLLRQADQAIGCAALGALAARCARLPELHPTAREDAGRRHEEKEAILTALTTICADDPGVAGAVDRELSAIAGEADRLDDLLEAQHYRLARWQVGAQDLDYRRFFDIQSLAGLRVEDPQVFEDTHRLLLGWLDRGRLDGLRIDHVDGLRDPQQYLDRLAAAASGTPIWVEKILEFGERLPDAWPVAGTTGYDGGALIQQVLLDAAGERALTQLWDAFGEERRPSWPDLAREAREEALQTSLAADLARLAEAFVQVGEQNRRFRDFTRVEVTEALQGVLSVFPCYRTYVRPADGTVRAQDAGMIRTAVAAARDARPHLDAELFDLLAAILLGEGSSDVESEFVARFQQTSGPVRAKGVEDTAFYRYLRLVALNEVGADPGRFGCLPAEFHGELGERAGAGSRSMVTTMSHDAKRGEDVRWRLSVLSEWPERWEQAVWQWSRMTRAHRQDELPDRAAEYLVYQTLVGAWPISADRLQTYLLKAMREAKVRTSWTAPDEAYETALLGFCSGCLGNLEFLASLEAFVGELQRPAQMTSLSAKLLALTAPGVPDVYQGAELWDLRLVDPDNRGPVDFELRAAMLDEAERLPAERCWEQADQGLAKLLLVTRTLRLRLRSPEAFDAAYQPLAVVGDRSANLLASLRGERVIVLAPRLLTQVLDGWGDTSVELPPGCWRDELTGSEVGGGRRAVGDLLQRFPVGLLSR